MRYKTLQDVPTSKLRKWLATAERTFGPTCPTAKVYRTELRRRMNGVQRKGVADGR